MRSSMSSIPAEMRTRSSGKPRAARTSAGMEAWLMKHGRLISDVTFPKLTGSVSHGTLSAQIDVLGKDQTIIIRSPAYEYLHKVY